MANQLPGGGGDDGGSGGGGSGDSFVDQIKAAIPGIPDSLAGQLADILRNDPSNGWANMFATLRASNWFGQAYAGFNEGVQSTLFSGAVTSASDLVNTMTDYRRWQGGITNVYSQYFGRQVSASELMDYASHMYDVGTIEQIGQGHSLAMSQGNDWQYYFRNFDQGGLSQSDLEAYGQLLSGRSSDLGLKIQARLQSAMQRAQSLFSGTLATAGNSSSGGFAKPLSTGSSSTDIGA